MTKTSLSLNIRLVAAALAIALLLLSGCRLPTEAPRLSEPAASAPEAAASEPAEPETVDSAVAYSGSGVTVTANAPRLDGTEIVFTVSVENSRGEDIVWTMDSVTVDSVALPVGAVCSVSAGTTVRYDYSFSALAAMAFGLGGTHEAYITSTLTTADGAYIGESVSAPVTVSLG